MSEEKEREERIAARRARISAAREAARNGGPGPDELAGAQAPEDNSFNVLGPDQIKTSRAALNAVKTQGIEHVTAIRVEGDERESSRRALEEEKAGKRTEALERERETSAQRNAAIALKWSGLYEKTSPQDLADCLDGQKASCDDVIDSKNAIISDYRADIKAKDDAYVRALIRQAEDIKLLIERMNKHVWELNTAYDNELEEIEKALMSERKSHLTANKAAVEALMEERRTLEAQYMEIRQGARDKLGRIEQYQQELDSKRVQDAEEYNALKIRLETGIQNLEQQLEEMRATYQLNTEKLEYNYRVLSERDIENSNTISQQKRKIAKLQDVISNLMVKYAKMDKQYRLENHDLTDEYKRITEQFKDLQHKFRHFEVADNKRYQEIWAMHEENVMKQVKSVLQADKIIHEQQLGREWVAPPEEMFQTESGASNDPGAISGHGSLAAAAAGEEPTGQQDVLPSSSDGGDAKQREEAPRSASSAAVQGMLKVLCDQAGFLVEDKVHRMLDTLPKDEQNLLKTDSILAALGVETEEDVQKLLGFFTKEKPASDDEEVPVDGGVVGELIAPEDALKALQRFAAAHQGIMAERAMSRASTKAPMSSGTTEDVKEAARKEEMQFWDRMANILPKKKFRVWTALEKGLQSYNAILTERSALVEDISALRGQNDELKVLLNNYLTSGVNKELQIPPTAVLGVSVDEPAAPQRRG